MSLSQRASVPPTTGRIGLVGDIGGTNARFALTALDGISQPLLRTHGYACNDFPSVEDALDAYLQGPGEGAAPCAVVLAVAGPKNGDAVQLTNAGWRISERSLASRSHVKVALIINDYAALAFAGPCLPSFSRQIGLCVKLPDDGVIAIVGAGTGFGASAHVRAYGRGTPLVTEGGHIAWAPTDDLEVQLWRALRTRFPRISVERILSGPGLMNLDAALADVEGRAPAADNPAALVALAQNGHGGALRTVDMFWRIMASVAGDFALAYGARAGVFLAGGVTLRLLPLLDEAVFRERFEDKGRFSPYLQAIPTCAVLEPEAAALQGAARVLRHEFGGTAEFRRGEFGS